LGNLELSTDAVVVIIPERWGSKELLKTASADAESVWYFAWWKKSLSRYRRWIRFRCIEGFPEAGSEGRVADAPLAAGFPREAERAARYFTVAVSLPAEGRT